MSEAGEDVIYVDESKRIAVNKEVYNDEVLKELGLEKSQLKEEKSIEVGNIFTLATKFSEPLNLTSKNKEGEDVSVFMGSYGIGPGRLMGTVVETHNDDKGIIWPDSIAPFDIHLVELNSENSKVKEKAEEIYKKLSETKEVLWDDREARAGEKFADADLIGIPLQIIVSERGLEAGTLEVKNRATGEVKNVDIDRLTEEM